MPSPDQLQPNVPETQKIGQPVAARLKEKNFFEASNSREEKVSVEIIFSFSRNSLLRDGSELRTIRSRDAEVAAVGLFNCKSKRWLLYAY